MPKRKKIEDRRAVYQLLYDKVPPQQQQQLQQPDRIFQVSIAFIYDSARFGGYQPNPT